MEGIYLEIDASELDAMVARLSSALTPKRVDQVMYGIFRRTEGHVRRILQQDLPIKYEVKKREVGKAVRSARLTGGSGGGAGCIIPVTGARKSIGGSFKAYGGAKGWASVRKKYRVRARIVTAGISVLPGRMGSYGGMPPFRNLSAAKLNGVTFTRKGAARLPILKVSGIAVPQMPVNRSEPDVQEDIRDFLYRRMEHELQRLVGG